MDLMSTLLFLWKTMNKARKIQGFTLIEFLITIAVIGILSGTLLPFLLGAQKRAYDTGASACAKSIQTVQGISMIDSKEYMLVGSGANQINRSTDGINATCKTPYLYYKDRSSPSNMKHTYTIDLWDSRGKEVFTITDQSLEKDAIGATPFSSTGLGGANIP
ncbi:hypothetical protein CBQ26_01015 [Deinococcus indicus]|uniref:Uncharacterized protein n=2 Tax=Deinococcus indicus TaxID=223556 RepID=A0A246BT26_9DEIO|nr:hypothetical protein CBQ26_01015 [Deinococcus indicus]